MGKFNKNSSSRELPTISTASLPDIIFMLLFFFMATTQMKEVDFKVSIKEPKATELEALEKKNLVRFIYVGTPTDTEVYMDLKRVYNLMMLLLMYRKSKIIL